MAKKQMAALFEKSKMDKEPKGSKEGSKVDKKMDAKKMPAFMKKSKK